MAELTLAEICKRMWVVVLIPSNGKPVQVLSRTKLEGKDWGTDISLMQTYSEHAALRLGAASPSVEDVRVFGPDARIRPVRLDLLPTVLAGREPEV